MTNSGDAAEQIVRMSLEGTEVALRLSGSAAKNIAVALYAIVKNADRNKTKGHQRLSAMLKSGKELKVFTISEEHLKCFAQEAKRYGVVYNRIVERFKLATVDTASIKRDIEKDQQEKKTAPDVPEQSAPQKEAEELLLDELFGAPIQKEAKAPENPTAAKAEKSPPSEPISRTQRKTAEGTSKESRPSVREKLREIKAARQEKTARVQDIVSPVKQPEIQPHIHPGKKPKVKVR